MNIVDKIEQYGLQDWIEEVKSIGELQPFEQARKFARSLGLKNRDVWYAWAKTDARPDDIPSNARDSYINSGWVSWGDWLGTKNRIGGYKPFKQARYVVRSVGLRNWKEWREWRKTDARPDDIPASPDGVYKDSGWVSLGDWLGTKNRRGGWMPFEEARAFVRLLGLKTRKEWNKWAKTEARLDNIPAAPDKTYRDNGWVGVKDWLGTK